MGPLGIATGPDGNIWATQFSGNQISKVSPADVFLNNYTVPTANSNPFAIVSGPDGNLWFSEYQGTT